MAARDFHLVDLISQGRAVERLLAGHTTDAKLGWLALRGTVYTHPTTSPDWRQVYTFESHVGRRATFFFNGDTFVFFGDHSTFTARE